MRKLLATLSIFLFLTSSVGECFNVEIGKRSDISFTVRGSSKYSTGHARRNETEGLYPFYPGYFVASWIEVTTPDTVGAANVVLGRVDGDSITYSSVVEVVADAIVNSGLYLNIAPLAIVRSGAQVIVAFNHDAGSDDGYAEAYNIDTSALTLTYQAWLEYSNNSDSEYPTMVTLAGGSSSYATVLWNSESTTDDYRRTTIYSDGSSLSTSWTIELSANSFLPRRIRGAYVGSYGGQHLIVSQVYNDTQPTWDNFFVCRHTNTGVVDTNINDNFGVTLLGWNAIVGTPWNDSRGEPEVPYHFLSYASSGYMLAGRIDPATLTITFGNATANRRSTDYFNWLGFESGSISEFDDVLMLDRNHFVLAGGDYSTKNGYLIGGEVNWSDLSVTFYDHVVQFSDDFTYDGSNCQLARIDEDTFVIVGTVNSNQDGIAYIVDFIIQ